ncbi:hypothetical protein RB200_19745 [Streptomyces sp. PmtG]
MTSPIRALQRFIAPAGRHRTGRRVVLLPDEPLPPADGPITHGVLGEDELEQLLDAEEIAANESAPCPCCGRTTLHAMFRSGARRCWTCQTDTPAGGAS